MLAVAAPGAACARRCCELLLPCCTLPSFRGVLAKLPSGRGATVSAARTLAALFNGAQCLVFLSRSFFKIVFDYQRPRGAAPGAGLDTAAVTQTAPRTILRTINIYRFYHMGQAGLMAKPRAGGEMKPPFCAHAREPGRCVPQYVPVATRYSEQKPVWCTRFSTRHSGTHDSTWLDTS